MYFNNAQCDIYIGTGAGKKLMEEMASAHRSVKIVSPFLSAQLLSGLLQLHERGILVELITTEGEQINDRGMLAKLIQQHVHVNGRAKNIRRKVRIALWTVYGIGSVLLLASWFFFMGKELQYLFYDLMALGVVLLAFGLLRHVRNKVKVYSYTYEPIFPIKVIRNHNDFGQRATYLHSKIYIIDDRIAYLGSLNFTDSGTKRNYETRVRLTDVESVQRIVEEFRYLMDRATFPIVDYNLWGKMLFPEPTH